MSWCEAKSVLVRQCRFEVCTTHHDGRAGVAHGEPLSGDSAEERAAARGAEQAHVADDDVFLCAETGAPRRVGDHGAAGQALQCIRAPQNFDKWSF